MPFHSQHRRKDALLFSILSSLLSLAVWTTFFQMLLFQGKLSRRFGLTFWIILYFKDERRTNVGQRDVSSVLPPLFPLCLHKEPAGNIVPGRFFLCFHTFQSNRLSFFHR